MSKIDVKEIDLSNLEDLAADDYFQIKEKVGRNLKAEEDTKYNRGHKKTSHRKPKPE